MEEGIKSSRFHIMRRTINEENAFGKVGKNSMILNVHKPKGISSFQCVSEVRRRTKAKSWTCRYIDLNAEGVLPVMLDKSIRVNEFLDFDKGWRMNLYKETDTVTYGRGC